MNVVAILLAAGSATRFGSDKLLHALPHEVPIAIQAARHLRAVFEENVFVVVRPEAKELAGLVRKEGCEVVVCENAAEGMGASLACAVRAAGAADAYLIALADMPFIRASTIAAVRDALAGGAALVAPYFRARRGHPVGLSANFRMELEALRGDEGARKVLTAHALELLKIPVGDPGVIRDIDTPGDLTPPVVV
ncbi:MAG: nucleotidyltransferase family protein [Betaproteobacteria bacterium]|nr:nucleotidyltransferase family protein [Betaproteobacteria bacterium]